MTWSENFISIFGGIDNQVPKFEITDTKIYVPVVTLSTQENAKLLHESKSGFNPGININQKYQCRHKTNN